MKTPKTQAEKAKHLGISTRQLQRLQSEPTAPKRWADFQRWYQSKRSTRTTAAEARGSVAYWRSKLLELEYEREAGQLVSRTEADRCMNDMATTIKNEGDQLRNKLPPLLAGKDLPEMSRVIDEAWRDVCRAIADAPLDDMQNLANDNQQQEK